MLMDSKTWHCLALTMLSALFRCITSNLNEDFYCLNCLHLFQIHSRKTNLINHKFYRIIMPIEDERILKYHQGEKSIKLSLVVYVWF